MSDIKKQLVLEVSLGTQKLKSEIAGLKKDLESVGRQMSGGAGTAAAKKSGVSADLEKAKQINMAYKQRQKEQDQIEKAYSQRQKEITREQEKATRELNKISTKKENEARKEAQRLEKQTEKEIKQNETAVEKEQQAKIKAEQKEQKRAELQRTKELNAEKKTIQERFEFLKKKRLEDDIKKSQLDRTATARIARALGVPEDRARGLAESVQGGGSGGLMGLLRRGGGLMALGQVAAGGANAYEDFRMLQASRRHESTSNLLGGQFVSQYSRDYGRQFSMSHVGATAGGAAMGAGGGALLGAAIGSIIPGLGTAVGALIGGLGGAIYKGIDSYMGMSEKRAARFQKETQPLQDATNAAMQLNSARLGMVKRGASEALLNINERQAAAMGFGPGEANEQFSQLQDIIGTTGAATSINTARRLNLNTGAGIGDTGNLIQALTGGNRQAIGANAAATEMVVSRAFANGLDRSKTSKFLQETTSYIQNSTQFSRLDTGTLTDRFTGLASTFGNGTIDDTSMRQAQQALQMQYQDSFSKGGLAGLGNVFNFRDKVGGLGLGGVDTANLLNLSQNATVDDAFKLLSPEAQAKPGIRDALSELIQSKSQNVQRATDQFGLPMATLMKTADTGLSAENAMNYIDKTRATALNAGVDIENQEVAGSQAQGMAIRNAQLSKAEVDLGRETFKTAIDNTAADLDRLKTAFSDAVKVFNDVLKDMNMKQVQYNPSYSGSGRGNGQ